MQKQPLLHAIAYAFIVLASIAAVLNSLAAVVNTRRGHWVEGMLHFVIAVSIGSMTFLGWYSMARQPRYTWRDSDER
jgi:hypothetical protein